MAITVVGSPVTGFALAGSVAPTINGVTAGSALIFIASVFGGVGTGSITDDKSNPGWAQDIKEDDGTNQVEIWSVPNVASGNTQVTFTGAGGTGAISYALIEVSGLATSGIKDKTASADSPSTTSVVSGTTATTTTANEILIAVMGHSGGAPTITQEGTWMLAYEDEDNNNHQAISAVYKIVSATGAQSHTWTIGSAVSGIGCIATYQETGGGGGGAEQPIVKRMGGVPGMAGPKFYAGVGGGVW